MEPGNPPVFARRNVACSMVSTVWLTATADDKTDDGRPGSAALSWSTSVSRPSAPSSYAPSTSEAASGGPMLPGYAPVRQGGPYQRDRENSSSVTPPSTSHLTSARPRGGIRSPRVLPGRIRCIRGIVSMRPFAPDASVATGGGAAAGWRAWEQGGGAGEGGPGCVAGWNSGMLQRLPWSRVLRLARAAVISGNSMAVNGWRDGEMAGNGR